MVMKKNIENREQKQNRLLIHCTQIAKKYDRLEQRGYSKSAILEVLS